MIHFPNCKINLGLYVTGKRADGFHSIESIFVPVQLCDVLEVVPSQNGQFDLFVSGGRETIGRENNICWKALMTLRADFKLEPSHLYLHKTIPTGAGLGGGSADGAFALCLLNDYYNLQLSTDALKEYASRLGSDCPFFIENKICLVTGRGEIMQPLEINLTGITIVIVHPSLHISTTEAYSLITPATASFDLARISELPRKDWKNSLSNDFEKPITMRYPEIQSIKDRMYEMGAFYASMSGSGSAVYGLFESHIEKVEMFQPHFTWKGAL